MLVTENLICKTGGNQSRRVDLNFIFLEKYWLMFHLENGFLQVIVKFTFLLEYLWFNVFSSKFEEPSKMHPLFDVQSYVFAVLQSGV